MTYRAMLASGLLLLAALASPVLAQDSPQGSGAQEGGTTGEATTGPGVGGIGGVNNTTSGGGVAGNADGNDPTNQRAENVGGYQATPGGSLLGLGLVFALLGIGYLFLRRRGRDPGQDE